MGRAQTMPIVAVGDHNFDYDFRSGNGNESFSTQSVTRDLVS